MRNCCSERDLKSAARWGLIAWAIAMLVAIATFLPGDVYAQEAPPDYTILDGDGSGVNDAERELVKRYSMYLQVTGEGILEEFGNPILIDPIHACAETDDGEVCADLIRIVYVLPESADHLLIFIVEGATNRVGGWVVREIEPEEREIIFGEPNPFGGTFR